MSLKEYAEKIGYSRNAVLGAVRVLKLKVGRVPSGSVIRTLKGSKQRMWTGRFYRFETDHQKAILDYLTKKDRLHQWGIDGRPDRCVKCHRTTFFHCRLGYCRRCVANLRDRAKKGKGGEEAQLIHKTRQVRKAYVRKKPYKYRIVQCLECRRKVRVYVVVLPRFKGKCRLCRHNHNQRVNRRKQTIQKRLTHEDREDA